MKVEDVLPALRKGNKIRRECWKSYKKYIYLHFENSNNRFQICFHKNNSEDDETWLCIPFADLIADDWEIVEEPKKVKLRDLSKRKYVNWWYRHCFEQNKCEVDCPLKNAKCDARFTSSWINHKDLYSDKFLDQEIEVEE